MSNRTAVSAPEAPTCRHHWMIESPDGPTSRGRCKVCGAERDFMNSFGDNFWEDRENGVPGVSLWSILRRGGAN
ncbi:MAG TPA: hypothetical protein VFT91_06570 [Dehalococcoidia bacterium]|nr:hypothetical protein [Dehalococcoidia bacterium]